MKGFTIIIILFIIFVWEKNTNKHSLLIIKNRWETATFFLRDFSHQKVLQIFLQNKLEIKLEYKFSLEINI